MISPSTGFSMVISQNAKYLFLASRDSWYADNTSPGPISVIIEKQASAPSSGVPLEYILAAVGVVAAIAILPFSLWLSAEN